MSELSQDAPGRRRRRRVVLAATAVTAVGAMAACLWVVQTYGPAFGVHLTPPSPQRYAEVALGHLQSGLHADGPRWQEARADLERAARSADSYSDVHDALRAAARAAGGRHSFLLTPQEAQQAAGSSTSRFEVPAVTTQDGVTTVTVPQLGSVSPELRDRYARAAADGIAAAAPATCGWVVDLRGNTGGDMHPMLAGLAALLPDGTAFEMVARDGRATAVTVRPDGISVAGGTTTVGRRAKVVGAPVAVLQDAMTASSGEAVLTAFRGLDGVASFGAPSAGYTSANMTHTLYDGALLALTVAVYVDRDGVDLAELPIEPDHPVHAAQAHDAARAWLAEQRACAPA